MAFPVAGYGQGQKRSAVGGGNSGLQLLLSLINQQQGGFDEAKQANESRYNDILELFGNNRARTNRVIRTFSSCSVTTARVRWGCSTTSASRSSTTRIARTTISGRSC
jgi:hypothetical protein